MRKNDYRIAVIADDRERKSKVIKFLSDMKNVSVAVKATSEELQSVEGIGESIAEGIKWAVREQMHPYGVIDEFPT